MDTNLAYLEWLSSSLFHDFETKEKEKQAQDFINQLILHLKPKRGSRVLDSACGQGLHSMHFTSLGFDVTGVDMSTANIGRARAREQNNPEFFQHDIRLPFWGNYFHLAVNLFDGFGYYRTRRENEAAFRTIASSLQPNGTLIIDYPNTHFIESRISEFNFTQKLHGTEYRFELTQNDTHFLHKITITTQPLNEPREFAFRKVKLSVGDLTEMLAFQKMQVKEVFGDYSLAAYHLSDTPRLVVIAAKN